MDFNWGWIPMIAFFAWMFYMMGKEAGELEEWKRRRKQ